MCCSGKCDLSNSADVVQLCVRIMDDQCKDEDDEWDKEKLLNHLKNKLIKAYSSSKVSDETYQKECDEIVNYGIYSELVLSKFLKNGLSKEDVIKLMKYGLENKKFKHLNYHHILNITEQTMNEELIQKLKEVGFSDEESSDIVLNGLINQNECYLFQLTSHNIFATKIWNWQGRMSEASNSIMEFLQKLGLDEHTLKTVSEKGISAEAKEIIKELGYCAYNQRNFSNNIEESICSCMDKHDEEKSNSTKLSQSCDCITPNTTILSGESYERKNFIRKNLMAPLTWAMNETLKYNPTDPVHYIACQLLRWKHNNVDESEMKKVTDFVIKATVNN